MEKLKVIDLFCGCGGMSWGLHKANFSVLAGIDNWQPALETFKLNHPQAIPINADIRTLNPKEVMDRINIAEGEPDCIVGGPPCQGFSKNIPASCRFLEDPKNQLFRYFMSFVKAMYPKTAVMENVAEIYNAYSGGIRNEIVSMFESLGYKINVRIMYAPDYGIPQRRKRCIFFASRTGADPVFPEPAFSPSENYNLFNPIKKYRTAWAAISDLPELENGEGSETLPYNKPPRNEYQAEMRLDSELLYDHISKKLNEKQLIRIASLKPGQGMKDLSPDIRPKSGYSGAYGRLDFEMIAPTITRWVFHPGSGRFCHPKEARLITIREAARIQSFSDDFIFRGTYLQKSYQVGNAVPPLLMYALADNIRKACSICGS